MKLYVNYEVRGSRFQAGPYSVDDAIVHFEDISGYEAVTDCYVSLYRDEERRLIS